MRTKFFLCMRPTVIEPEDGGYVKLPPKVRLSFPTVSDNTSAPRNRYLQQRKTVAADRCIRQPSIKSDTACFSVNISEDKSEDRIVVEEDSQKGKKTTSPVSEPITSKPSSGEKLVSFKKQNMTSNGKDSGGPESNSGVYLMVSSLIFTIYLGKFFGILCTLILICSMYPHRKCDHHDGGRSENMEANSPEKGSRKEYKKRIIMEGLLERKSHIGY